MDETVSAISHSSLANPTISNKILSLYTRGLSSAAVLELLRDTYDVWQPQVVINATTDAVLKDYNAWQDGALDRQYIIVFFDSLTVKFRVGTEDRKYTVLLALGIDLHGQKCPLGFWLTADEGRHAWQLVLTELKHRGVNDIFIACMYGQLGAREAIAKVFPAAQALLCVVRLIDNSLNFIAWKHRKEAASALRGVYTCATVELAAEAMTRVMCDYDDRYPTIGRLWQTHWDGLAELFNLPRPLREAVYSTTAIQSLHQSLAKVSKRHGVFTEENDLLIRLYLSQHYLVRRWGQPLRHWRQVLNCLATTYENRLRIKF